MKKILMVLGIFVALGFVFTGVDVASAAEECIVGPLNVSNGAHAISRNGEKVSVKWTMTDRVSQPPRYSRNGEKVLENHRSETNRLSQPPQVIQRGRRAAYVTPDNC